MAGDRGAAKTIYGRSKVYLDVDGIPMVARIVLTLQDVARVDSVWVVGDSDRLEAVFAAPKVRERITKPFHITEQHSNLIENAWETFTRALPGAGPDGKTPKGEEIDFQVVFLSGDLPFATPQEITSFIDDGSALDCDYVLGLAAESSLTAYQRETPGEGGLDVAFFNLKDGRLRQSNLHLAKPARILNRENIQEMYRHRHMREFGNMIGLGSRLFFREGGIAILFFYMLMHFGGLADRWGWRRIAHFISRGVSLKTNEWGISKLLACNFRFVVTPLGGCAIDVDTEEEYDQVQAHFEKWSAIERERAEAMFGPLPTAISAESSNT